MKYKIATLMIIVMSMISSCGALKHVTFYQSFNEAASIPAIPVANVADSITSPDIPTNVAAQLKANNTSPNLVQSIMLQTMTLTITAPPAQTFAFIKDIQVFILTDSLPAVEIANQYNINSTSDTLNMNVDATELKPYLLSNSFRMKFIVTSGQATTQSMTLNAYLKFKFEANLLAAL